MRATRFSIRHKVIIGVAAVYLLMAAAITGSYYFMRLLEDKIGYLEDVSKLEESVLEMRRFEKNFFLYGDSQSLRTALYHLERVKGLLAKNVNKIIGLSSPEMTSEFARELDDYQRLLQECSNLAGEATCPPEARSGYETKIRTTGSSIAQFSETVAKRKRDSIKQTMSTTVQLLWLGFAVVGIGLAAVGSFLLVKVTKPLKLLENSTEKIARGDFEPIESLPPEKEIRDIFHSFNRMAVQLRDREEQLVQSKKLAALGTMLAGVAHEVNNPLSNISSSCEILLEELDEADREWQRSLLKKVLEQVEKARNIVLNLLEFSRSKEFNKERSNLKQLVDKTVSLLQAQIPAGVLVETQADEKVWVDADRQRLEQVFMNLILNAVQAIEGEGTVKVRVLAAKDGMVSVRIKDTGKGIAEEDLPRIFDPFFTTKDVGKGTGLGLFIAHDIVVRHKGTIRVESAQGKGTTFLVNIPTSESAA
ncbi:MAG: HAMP domain-containing protein [Desulfomonile tiedjei]|nr:HAMP domain-containing protein [Desulfomonile tiedjei]